MEPMSRELLVRRPAAVRPYQVLTGSYHQKHALVAQAQKLSRAGRIEVLQARPEWSPRAQRWELPVRELAAPSPWPRRLLVLGGVGGFLLALLWLLSTLTATALAVLCATALAGLALILRAGRRPSISVTTITQTKIR